MEKPQMMSTLLALLLLLPWKALTKFSVLPLSQPLQLLDSLSPFQDQSKLILQLQPLDSKLFLESKSKNLLLSTTQLLIVVQVNVLKEVESIICQLHQAVLFVKVIPT